MMPFTECHETLRTILPRFYPALLAGATVFFAPAAQAQMSLDPECRFDPGRPDSCVHVIACLGQEDLFVGGAIGWDAGHLVGKMSTGAACVGLWDNAIARAEFECDDGTTGTVQYLRRDDITGTAIGLGQTGDGRSVEVWSGENVADYIRRETGEVTLTCGPATLLMM